MLPVARRNDADHIGWRTAQVFDDPFDRPARGRNDGQAVGPFLRVAAIDGGLEFRCVAYPRSELHALTLQTGKSRGRRTVYESFCARRNALLQPLVVAAAPSYLSPEPV